MYFALKTLDYQVIRSGESLPSGKPGESVMHYRRREGGRRERGECGVGSIPISTNHIFFFFFYLKSLPLHQMSKPLPTLFTKYTFH
ncbi:hypothetical protein Hanom_Chr03g00273091 [Helianthus anomalus]